MATITAYATGTITSVTGTTVVISGGAVAGWVGRCIALSSGAGAGQSRKIVAFVSATQITIDFAFANTYTSSALSSFADVDPASGDSFVISSAPADYADGTTVIVDPGTNVVRFVGASALTTGAFLYFANYRVELTSSSITGNQALEIDRVRWRFGDIDAAGNVYNGCYLLDLATAPSGFGTGAASSFDPDFEFYGGIIRCNGAAPFWRFHTDANERVRMLGLRVDGTIGGRMIGSRSVFDDWEVYGNTSASGPFNAKSPFGKISNIRISKSLQAGYHFWPDSMTLEVEGIQLGPSVDRFWRFANNTTSGQTLTVKNVDISAVSAVTYLWNNVNGSYSNTFRLSQYVNASYRNAAGVAVTDTSRFILRDNVPATIYDSTVTDGVLPRQQVRYRDMTVRNTGNYTWASAGGTTYAPYSLAVVSYLYVPATASLALLTSADPSLLALTDSNISETTKSTVDAYTEIDTLDRLYDRAKSWTVDNLALANPSFGAQLANGNGTELNLGAFDLVVDASAASAFTVVGNTITIKATTLAAGSKFQTLRTTGTLTLLNGAAMGISYTTGAGSFAAIAISGLVAGSRIQLYNVTDATELDNTIVAGTSYNSIFAWPGVRTVRLRVSKMGYEDFEQSGQFLASGMSFIASTPIDAVYTANGVDGSTVTEFASDYPNVQIDINDLDGVTSIQRLNAWYHYITETADGIRYFFGGLIAEDELNYRIVTSIVSIKLDNVGAVPVVLLGARLYRDDDTTVIGNGAIQIDPKKAYSAGLGTVSTQVAEMHAIAGLKSGTPMTVTPTTRTAGDISLAITGDGITTTTVTRA